MTGKKIIRILIIAAVTVTACEATAVAAGAEHSSPGFLAYRPDRETIESEYRDCEAVVLCDSVFIELKPSGLTTTRRHRAVLLITDNSIGRYADPKILFHRGKHELRVTGARVYMRDGRVVDTGENGFNVITPHSLAGAPDYQDWQEMVVTHLGIQNYCTAELEYRLSETEEMLPWLSGVEFFGGPDPILHRYLSIRVPPGASLKYSSLNRAPDPVRVSDNELAWSISDLEGRYIRRDGMWKGDYLPAVVYSTAESWEAICEYYDTSLSAAAHASDSMEVIIEEGKDRDQPGGDNWWEISRFAFESIRGIHPPFHPLHSGVRDADVIYSTAYGHTLDRVVYAMAMLRRKGYPAGPVFVSGGRNWPDDVPAPEIFNRVLLEIPAGVDDPGEAVSQIQPEGKFRGGGKEDSGAGEWVEDTILLDPVSSRLAVDFSALAGRTVARCGAGSSVMHLPGMRPEQNISLVEIKAGLEGDVIRGEAYLVITGVFSPYWEIRDRDEGPVRFLEGYCGSFLGGADLEDWSVKVLEAGRVELGFRFQADLPEETGQGRIYLSIPEAPCGRIWVGDEIESARSEYPVPVEVIPSIQEVRFRLEGPGSWKLASSGWKISEENQAGRVLSRLTEKWGEEISFKRQLRIDSSVVPSAQFGAVNSLIGCFGENRLVLERAEENGQ